MKFKSLSMRIWTMFTIVIFVIISCIMILYLLIYANTNEEQTKNDLITVHNTILNNDMVKPAGLADMSNLIGSDDMLIKNGKVEDIENEKLNRNQLQNRHYGHKNDDLDDAFRKVLMSYEGKDTGKEVKKVNFMNQSYLVISTNTDKGTLVSYVPMKYNSEFMQFLIFVGILFAVVGFVISKVVAGYITKPLVKLEAFTHRIAAKNFDEPIQIDSIDEIGRLVNSMNKMQAVLKHREEKEREFLHGISHELKTPAMVIMSHADALIDGIYIESPANTAEIIKNEAIKLSKKINKLLYVNTLDYSLENTTLEDEINIAEFLNGLFIRFQTMRPEINWSINTCEAVVKGDFNLLATAFENIIENAVRYAVSQIGVNAEIKDDRIVIDIYNDGEKIGDDNLTKIFNNFNKGRNGRFGLGLAVSRKIIEHYGGSIRAVNYENKVSFICELKIDGTISSFSEF